MSPDKHHKINQPPSDKQPDFEKAELDLLRENLRRAYKGDFSHPQTVCEQVIFMDLFDEEILKFWAALQKHELKYIMMMAPKSNDSSPLSLSAPPYLSH
jgi:hypothetical protein